MYSSELRARRLPQSRLPSTASSGGSADDAQKWPSRTVTIVVSFPAGGPTDVLARAIADDLAEKFRRASLWSRTAAARPAMSAPRRSPRPRPTADVPVRDHECREQPLHVQESRLRHRSRFCAGGTDRQDADRVGGEQEVGLQVAWRPHRRRQGQPGQDQLRLARPRHRRADRGRTAGDAVRHQADARALSRLDPDDRRSPRQPDRRGHRPDADADPAAQGRQLRRPRHDRRGALGGAARSADGGGERLSRISRPRPGMRCWRRPGRPRT